MNRQKELLGENLCGSPLPIFKNGLRMPLAGTMEHLWTNDLKNYVAGVTDEQHRYIDILMRTSGEGKTARLFAVATQIYLVYISAEGSPNNTGPKSILTENSAYKSLIDSLQKLQARSPVDIVREVRREVKLFLLVRLLHLRLLMDYFKQVHKRDLLPIEFFYLQLNGEQKLIKNIYDVVCDALKGFSELSVHDCLMDVLSSINAVKGIGFDEAQFAANDLLES